jgi:predicted RNA-binding Zn-ribbon protein involved in translation (DUF1610 family)
MRNEHLDKVSKNGKKSGSPADRSRRRKKMDPKKWAKKWLKDGFPLEMQKFSGFGDGKLNVCEVCGRRVSKLKVEFVGEKKVSRCEKCRSEGLTNENKRT